MVSRTNHIKNLQLCPNYADLYAFLDTQEVHDKINNQTNFFDDLFSKAYAIHECDLRTFYRLVDEAIVEGAELAIREIPQTYALPSIMFEYPRVSTTPFVETNLRAIAIRMVRSMAQQFDMYEQEKEFGMLVMHTQANDKHCVRMIATSYRVPQQIRAKVEKSWATELLPIFRTKIHADIVLSYNCLFRIQRMHVHEFFMVQYEDVTEQYVCNSKAFPVKDWGESGIASMSGELSTSHESPVDPFLKKEVLVISVSDEETPCVPEVEINIVARELEATCAVNAEMELLKQLCTKVILDSGKYTITEIIEALSAQSMNRILAQWLAYNEGWNEDQFKATWIRFFSMPTRDRRYGTETIHKWAREFKAKHWSVMKETVHGQLYKFAFESKGKLDHAQHADMITMLCSGRFVVDKINVGKQKLYTWYEFVSPNVNHKAGEVWKWRNEGGVPSELYTYIAREYRDLFGPVAQEIRRCKENHTNAEAIKALTKIESSFAASRSRLGSNTEQENIVKQCHHRLLRRGITDMLDKDGTIIGILNGIVKLGAKCEFIEGPHEFAVSKSTRARWMDWDASNPYIKRWLSAFLQIFGDEQVLEWMLVAAASQCDGLDKSDVLVNLIGIGSNGKSMFLESLYRVLGPDYYLRSGIEALTDKRPKQGGANENIAAYKGKRGGFFSETDEDEEIKGSNLKNIASSESLEARGIYEKLENFENTVFFFLATNHEMRTDAFDEGFWRRILVFIMPHQFVDHPELPNEFPKDESLKSLASSPEGADALQAILFHYYEIYITKYNRSLFTHVPDVVCRQTHEYRDRYDSLNLFLRTCIRPAPDIKTNLEHVAKAYQEWYKGNTGKKYTKDLRTTIQNMTMTKTFHNKTQLGATGISTYVVGYELITDE
ncbi:hypothetical protein KDA11_04675 [Candidatus Saccharibacteria bacterium]|nr:hypothetical protein [Candidatus Saccharibacteria bacterium]